MSGKKKLEYDPVAFQELLRRMLEKTGESYSAAARASGLHQTTISNYLRETSPSRPMRDACIALADHFGINPNEMLEAAGYEPLHFFDRTLIDPDQMSSEVKELAAKIQQIEDRDVRRRLIRAMSDLLEAYLPPPARAPAREPRIPEKMTLAVEEAK